VSLRRLEPGAATRRAIDIGMALATLAMLAVVAPAVLAPGWRRPCGD
jgi:hypothetical protein